MTNEAILAELGGLLAVGFQRRITSSIGPSADVANMQKPLDEAAHSEAPCVSTMETTA